MRRTVATLVMGALIASPITGVQARCADANQDLAPLKTAALQQELMVAALSCHAVRAYNRFVRNHQAELLDADGALLSYFAQRDGDGGTAGYNAFKTERANAASLRSAQDTEAFCYDADAEFDYVLRPASLAAIVEGDRLIVPVAYPACGASVPSTTFALADPRLARTRPAPARVMDADPPQPVSHGANASPGDSGGSTTARTSYGVISAPAPHRALDAAP
jgi:hypothetical protein